MASASSPDRRADADDARVVGVGPWPGGRAAWPDDQRHDPELLEHGDRRNVADRYRYWRVEAVRDDLDLSRAGVHVAVENWRHDLNIGSVARTANAVNAAGFHVVGQRRWNRRGAMVTDRYLHVHHHVDAAALASWASAQDLPVLGVDNVAGAVPLETYDLPERVVLLLGQEGTGLTPAAVAVCDAVLAIHQAGSTRSVNAGAAAAVALHAWVRRHVFGQVPGGLPASPSEGLPPR